MTAPKLTEPRRRALAVALLADERRSDRMFRESNQTTDPADVHTQPGSTVPAIYWQSLAWMIHEGLAEPVGAPARRLFRLTDAGRRRAAEAAA